MLASLLRPKKRREYAQNSLFPSPDPADQSRWPLLSRDGGYGRLREHRTDDDDAENESIEDEDADGEDEDAPIESSPLLPIFSAPHLGMGFHRSYYSGATLLTYPYSRRAPNLRYHTCYPVSDNFAVRNDVDLGPATLASDFAVLGETYSTENKSIALYAGHAVCADDELPTIRQGNSFEPRKQWHKPDQSNGERASRHKVAQRVHYSRVD